MNLEQVANQLSDDLRRSVKVVGLDDRTLAASGGSWLGDRQPLAVPIRGTAGMIASFWLERAKRPPLTATDYELIDVAAGIARLLLGDDSRSGPGSQREATVSRLLDDDPAARRAAFVDAVASHRVQPHKTAIVRALKIDEAVGVVRRISFYRRLAAFHGLRAGFLRESETVVYLITDDGDEGERFDAYIRAESARLGIAILASGSARVDTGAEDLAEAATRARIAMELVLAVPELRPAKDFSELGGWALLHSIPVDRSLIGRMSPAAEHLLGARDQLQRETIETYLDSRGQTRRVCELLHIHRTTLYYRLDNMPPVLREALDDGMKRSTLHFALKLIRLWESTGVV